MGLYPFVQFLHVRDRIHDAARPKHVRVLGEQGGRDYAGFMLSNLEVGGRKQEKEGRKGVFGKVIWQKFHGVGANNRDILIRGGGCINGRCTKSSNAIFHVLRDLYSNFHACVTPRFRKWLSI